MTFFRKQDSSTARLLSILISVVAAAGMWYMVSVSDRTEVQLELSINYYGMPQNLVVTSGLINKITVRLRGPGTLLRSIPQQRLVQSVELSHLKKGTTIIPLTSESMDGTFRAFEVVDVLPPRIVITADNLMERSVPIKTVVESPLRSNALTVENVSTSPATVILRGPESVISDFSFLPVTIRLDPKAAGTTVRQTLLLDTPSLVNAVPSAVQVQYTITSGRSVLSRRCKLKLETEDPQSYSVDPPSIDLAVEVPDALVRSTSYLRKLEAIVVPPPMDVGRSAQVDPRIRLPEGMTLLSPSVEAVTVTRLK